MSRIVICYTDCRLTTQNMVPTITGFQGTKRCIQYMASNTHKYIFYPFNYYYGSNVIRLTWSGNQVGDHTCRRNNPDVSYKIAYMATERD